MIPALDMTLRALRQLSVEDIAERLRSMRAERRDVARRHNDLNTAMRAMKQELRRRNAITEVP